MPIPTPDIQPMDHTPDSFNDPIREHFGFHVQEAFKALDLKWDEDN